jgi:hypothetical protein
MKIEKLIKSLSLAAAIIILSMGAMEKESAPLTQDEAKNKYLMIRATSHIPTWIRIKTTDGVAFVEKQERKTPKIEYQLPDTVSPELYTHSKYNDRLLVSQFEPLLIPYDQMRFPLRVRVWTYANKDKSDNDSTKAFTLSQETVEDLKAKGEKISITGRNPNNASAAFPEVEVQPKSWYVAPIGNQGDFFDIVNEKAKILTLETEEVR